MSVHFSINEEGRDIYLIVYFYMYVDDARCFCVGFSHGSANSIYLLHHQGVGAAYPGSS